MSFKERIEKLEKHVKELEVHQEKTDINKRAISRLCKQLGIEDIWKSDILYKPDVKEKSKEKMPPIAHGISEEIKDGVSKDIGRGRFE